MSHRPARVGAGARPPGPARALARRRSRGSRLRSLSLAILLPLPLALLLPVLLPLAPASALAGGMGTCHDPLEGLSGDVPAAALERARASCPSCPLTERAAYAGGADYLRCVFHASGQAVREGELSRRDQWRLVRSAWLSRVGRARPARTLLPGPGENGFDPALAQLARQYDRQFFTFHAAPFSMSLDVHVALDAHESRAAIADFLTRRKLASGPTAFRRFAGLDVFDVVEHYGEIGDLGMFGGVAAAGDAFRYAVLRDSCHGRRLGCGSLRDARRRLIEIMDVLHIAHAITGEHGVVARGLFRRGMPRRGGDPETVPLVDAAGAPHPPCDEKPENPSGAGFSQRLRFREDATQTVPGDPGSGVFPDWIWMDNASKDQLAGWVYAMGAVHDAVREDPHIPRDRVERLRADAAEIGRRLMRPAGPLGVDLTIVDGDGCATTFHDMHVEELEGLEIQQVLNLLVIAGPIFLFEPELRDLVLATRNAFNGLLGLAAMRTLCHVSRADDVCSFYYDELIDRRGWPQLLLQTPIPITELPAGSRMLLGLLGFPDDLDALGSLGIDFNHATNYSNVNMGFVGFYGLLRYEPEPELRALYAEALERSLWDTGINPRQPSVLGQSFFDLGYAGLRAGGTDQPAVVRGATTLSEFDAPPYWNVPRENCDAAELAAGACEGLDGTPIQIAPSPGRGGAVVAVDPVPRRIRPPSNFEWRSNPYAVNGGGGDRLNPGGDFRGAYWLGRFLRRGSDGAVNLAPGARGRDD